MSRAELEVLVDRFSPGVLPVEMKRELLERNPSVCRPCFQRSALINFILPLCRAFDVAAVFVGCINVRPGTTGSDPTIEGMRADAYAPGFQETSTKEALRRHMTKLAAEPFDGKDIWITFRPNG